LVRGRYSTRCTLFERHLLQIQIDLRAATAGGDIGGRENGRWCFYFSVNALPDRQIDIGQEPASKNNIELRMIGILGESDTRLRDRTGLLKPHAICWPLEL